ncbi:hypothetical protein G9A89_023813 [Geosiphon pyriformis]|nr:hypothetical protein G9A89_023813 [Geosiphon pyriformis]
MCNVWGMNVSAKQNNIVYWHKNIDNLVSIFTETKLKNKICPWIINKFDDVQVFTSGLDSGYLGAGVVVVMDFFLARHVCKVSEVSGWLLSIKLLFKNKLSVLILGLYAGASSVVWFSQADEINSLIAKAVNESFFIILGGDFNENSSHKSASFKKCFDLSLVNSLVGSPAVKMPTWKNSRGVKKTIDYVFVSPNLVNAIANREVLNVSKHFDMDHQAVSVSLGLGGLLDMCLNFICTQANKDCWKFNIKSVDEARWLEFKNASAANASMFSDAFGVADIIRKIMVLLAGGTFKKKWFKGFDGVFTKTSSRFHKLELLVSKLVKALRLASSDVVKSLFLSGSNFDLIRSALAKAKKSYCSFKLLEFKHVEKSSIKQAIGKRIESFELNKGHTIRSVLECPFHKVVLDHLVVEDELIVEPDLVKSKDLPDGKVAGLSGISNELWKHCDKSVLDLLLVFLNSCLVGELVPGPWKEAWEGVLTNTHLIALIEMAHKIFSKIFSDRISLACSTFEVFYGDNFSVLKGTMMQSLIFAIDSVVENALEKNHKLWLVLQDMRKAYNSVGWEHLRKSLVRIKMCDRFIRFFGSIHNGRVNRVMTDFGLTNGYCVHDRLNQEEVFLSLLWHIFYDSLLCKVKRQESVCGYRMNSHFISKTGRVDPQAGLTSFFTAGAFVDDTIWVGSSQAAIQHIFNVAMMDPHLTISGSPISIAKKGESHHYFGIFLSSKGFLKPSLTKVQTDVQFFVNLVLRKAVSDKQCAYLVSAVFFPIISYRTQFSFVSDALVCKILKSKSELPHDFPSDALHHLSLYNLKTFEQIQAKNKSAFVVAFVNSISALSWRPHHLLLFSARIGISPLNNFLVGVIRIFSGYDLSLGGTPMSLVLGEHYFFKCVFSLRHYGIAFVEQLCDHNGDIFSWGIFKHWKRLNPCGPVPLWFDLSVQFLGSVVPPSICPSFVENCASSDVCLFHSFGVICDILLTVDTAHLSRNTSGNCKDSLRKNPRQWVDFSSAFEKEYINTHNNQELKNNLHHNSKKKAFRCCPAESALTYYINTRINYHIGKEEEPHDAKLGLYRELSQYTTKEVTVIAATIVKIHREIEQYANKNFPIFIGNTRECANKTKENLETNQESNQQKLGTPAQTPKKTVTQSIKKQCIYLPEDKSYHFSPENKIQIPLGAASSSTSTPQTPRTPSYTDKIKQRNWRDIPITGGYSSLFQNPLFQPKFRTGFENRKEESKSESAKETSKKTITRPVTGTSNQSRNQETRDQEEELDIREATFRNA